MVLTMDITPFFIQYNSNGIPATAEIRPCCREDNVVDYAVWQNGKLAFTITKGNSNNNWVVALKNADEFIDDDMVQEIGKGIEKKIANH